MISYRSTECLNLTVAAYFCISGPGTYKPKAGSREQGGLMVTKDRRFKDLKSEIPGPGTYEVTYLV